MNPLLVCVVLLAAVCVSTWTASARSGSAAWLDRLWSILPAVYAWVFAAAAGFVDGRLVLLAILATAWGARLTFSYARKGGYGRGVEDYRWALLRRDMSARNWALFHALFVSGYQQVLLLLIALPAWTAYERRAPLTVVDGVLAIVFVVLLIGEGVADGQQWRFQQRKRAEHDAGGSQSPGFIQTGLFAYSRHPHFLCEILMWWTFYAIGVMTAAPILDWTIVGTAFLSAQIIGSTWMMEALSRNKYPQYAEYQARTSRLVPLPRRGIKTT